MAELNKESSADYAYAATKPEYTVDNTVLAKCGVLSSKKRWIKLRYCLVEHLTDFHNQNAFAQDCLFVSLHDVGVAPVRRHDQ